MLHVVLVEFPVEFVQNFRYKTKTKTEDGRSVWILPHPVNVPALGSSKKTGSVEPFWCIARCRRPLSPTASASTHVFSDARIPRKAATLNVSVHEFERP